MIRSIVSTAVAGLAGYAATKAVLGLARHPAGRGAHQPRRPRGLAHRRPRRHRWTARRRAAHRRPPAASRDPAGHGRGGRPRRRRRLLRIRIFQGTARTPERTRPRRDHDRSAQDHRNSARRDRGRDDPAQRGTLGPGPTDSQTASDPPSAPASVLGRTTAPDCTPLPRTSSSPGASSPDRRTCSTSSTSDPVAHSRQGRSPWR